MARTTGTASAPEDPTNQGGDVTRAQRHSAELQRSRLREHQRNLRGDPRAALRNVPPLPIHDRDVLEAQRAANIARERRDAHESRLVIERRSIRTRSATAIFEVKMGRGPGRTRATREATSDGKRARALADVISAFDEVDEEQSSTGDDPDYEEKALYLLGTAGSADEDDVSEDDEVEDDIERDEEDEDDEVSEVRYVRSSNVHRSSHQTHDLRVKLMSPVWFYGFKTTFESWEEFHECFDGFQTQTFQQFSKRTSEKEGRKEGKKGGVIGSGRMGDLLQDDGQLRGEPDSKGPPVDGRPGCATQGWRKHARDTTISA
ncbi:hypothetical protein ON010_g885 [Phytophthora cinnamomi]|nr:hypothetical protein ON010_g885 [Phytophthora cinnamomi]